MDIEGAKRIILYVVEKTKHRWDQYYEDWENIDEVFLRRGYEQGGFECWKFIGLLKEQGICSINSIGKILDKLDIQKNKKYNRDFAGSVSSPFYQGMKNEEYGIEGYKFYKCVENYLEKEENKKGNSFWKLLWYMLVCCNYLKNNYNASFSYFLKKKYCEYKKIPDITDSDFLNISPEDWEEFKKLKKPWKELYGIGENMFDFIVGDIKEAQFAINSFKLDSANKHFLKITGISKLIEDLNEKNVINFLKKLNLPYTLREINKGIYTYCSKTESSNFGFCRNKTICKMCGISDICEKNF